MIGKQGSIFVRIVVVVLSRGRWQGLVVESEPAFQALTTIRVDEGCCTKLWLSDRRTANQSQGRLTLILLVLELGARLC
jgi:hypothetical protein